jgi:hypothetical protein
MCRPGVLGYEAFAALRLEGGSSSNPARHQSDVTVARLSGVGLASF